MRARPFTSKASVSREDWKREAANRKENGWLPDSLPRGEIAFRNGDPARLALKPPINLRPRQLASPCALSFPSNRQPKLGRTSRASARRAEHGVGATCHAGSAERNPLPTHIPGKPVLFMQTQRNATSSSESRTAKARRPVSYCSNEGTAEVRSCDSGLMGDGRKQKSSA